MQTLDPVSTSAVVKNSRKINKNVEIPIHERRKNVTAVIMN